MDLLVKWSFRSGDGRRPAELKTARRPALAVAEVSQPLESDTRTALLPKVRNQRGLGDSWSLLKPFGTIKKHAKR